MGQQTSPRSGGRLHRLRRAMAFAFPYRQAVAGLFVITVFVAMINAGEPLILKYIFDDLEAHRQLRALAYGIGGLVALGVVREIGVASSNWLSWKTRIGIHYSLLEAMVGRLHRLPLSFHRTEGVGAIMTKLDRSIQGFLNAVTQILFNVFPAVLYLAIAIGVMMELNWKMAVLVICFAPRLLPPSLRPSRHGARNPCSTSTCASTRVSTRFCPGS